MSSYNAEFLAIYKAIQIANTLEYHQFVICTDSKAALEAIQNSENTAKGPNLIWNIILEITKENKNIKIHWVPGHSGIQGNVRVDELAKQAILKGTKIDNLQVPREDYNSYIQKITMGKFQLQFTSSTKGRWYKTINDQVGKPPCFKGVKLKRQEVVTICRARIGHANINNHLYKTNQYFTPMCLKCTLGEWKIYNTYSYTALRMTMLEEITLSTSRQR